MNEYPISLKIRGRHRGFLTLGEAADIVRDLTAQIRTVAEVPEPAPLHRRSIRKTEAREAAIAAVRCECCGAEVGSPCTRQDGSPRSSIHRARLLDWRASLRV